MIDMRPRPRNATKGDSVLAVVPYGKFGRRRHGRPGQ